MLKPWALKHLGKNTPQANDLNVWQNYIAEFDIETVAADNHIHFHHLCTNFQPVAVISPIYLLEELVNRSD